MTEYFKKYGQAVADNGYMVVPIRLGTKAPLGLDWSKKGGDSAAVAKWLREGYTHEAWKDKAAKVRESRTWSVAGLGIGALAETTPGVDIDCQDASVARHMIDFTERLAGKTICRIGLAPKSLLVYRAEEPFAKVNSATYLDSEGRNAKIEILGAGQQFVVLAVHPDTQKPYRWVDKKGVHNTPVADLPVLTLEQAQAIRDEFDRVARSRGWVVTTPNKHLTASGGVVAKDDPFADVAPKVSGVDVDEMRRLTMLVPGYDEYESWREIGMALFHQFDGSDVGLDIWDQWSQQGTKYDSSAVADKWSTFDIDGKGRAPLTARVILERSKEPLAEQIQRQAVTASEEIGGAQDMAALLKVCEGLKHVAFDDMTRAMLVGRLREHYKHVSSGVALSLADARRMLKYEEPDRASRFSWLRDYVYVQSEDAFFDPTTDTTLTPRAFDATYSRNLLSRQAIAEGKSTPDHLPQHIARNVAQIPTVAGRMYMPGRDTTFVVGRKTFVNSFTELSVPITADEYTVAGRAAIAKIEAHGHHLIANDRDRRMLFDVLAYIVQTNDRIGWSVFIQGVGGDGKSFFGSLMKAVLGATNTAVIRGAELKEKYSPWAEGSLFVMIEEVRLTGADRFDAVNNLKIFLTNEDVPVRRMGVDVYTVANRTTYFLTSNQKDGLPASEGERYAVLYSRWQDEEKLAAWRAKNPSYFAELFGCLTEAGEIRKWLLERKLSPEFNPRGRAPETSDIAEMKHAVLDDDTAALKKVLDEGHDADFSRALLDSSLLADRMTGTGAIMPVGRRLTQVLNKAGLSHLGETGFGGKTRRWWSNEPERFRLTDSRGIDKINGAAVQKWLDDWL